jgi:Baseplate J-like protein
MSITPVCQCDAANSTPITNLPGLTEIVFRAGDFNAFRRALLTPLLAPPGQPPLEQSLTAWQTDGADPSVADLGVMMAEWWAYLCDILTFYNERIANEDYLRTAQLPEMPADLIQILGYRPRPAIGATGTLAALVAPSVLPGQTVTLPKGLQFQSKPGPGAAPQTFELFQATAIGLPDLVPALPPPNLIASLGSIAWQEFSIGGVEMEEEFYVKKGHKVVARAAKQKVSGEFHQTNTPQYGVLLKGGVTSVSSGDVLLLGPRDAAATPNLITLSQAPAVQAAPGGGKQTLLSFVSPSTPGAMTAANARLTKANQSAPLWTVNGSAFNSAGTVIQMAGLVRQIRPNDIIMFSAPNADPQLVQVQSATDMMGDACSAGSPTSVSAGAKGDPTPIPVLHTQLTLTSGIGSWLSSAGTAAVSVLFGWVEVGTLIDQPPQPWTGKGSLQAVLPAQFPSAGTQQILLADSDGNGDAASGVGSGATLSVTWPVSTPIPLSPALQPPLNVYFNLLKVTRGQTVANEILGSGDATQAGQSFKLAKSPVTYLANSSGYASTITITVNGDPWTEVQSFYGQAADARVFVTREDSSQNTWVDFGDGVNGARLTTGANNVVATYRIGGGASSPPAGKLTVVAQSYPGLKSVVNPVAVSGGSDPDPAALLKEYAPRSVLAFNRAVSVFDYEALAAQAPGVTMAAASWQWDAVNLRASVTVYVAGEPNVATSVQTLLSAEGDPNRPVTVLPAKAITVTLTMAFVVVAGMDATAITTNLTAALCDPITGLFSPPQIGIGQSLFDSMIEAACLAVDGVVGIQLSKFTANGVVDPGPLHSPGEGAWFSLDPSNFFPSTEASGND